MSCYTQRQAESWNSSSQMPRSVNTASAKGALTSRGGSRDAQRLLVRTWAPQSMYWPGVPAPPLNRLWPSGPGQVPGAPGLGFLIRAMGVTVVSPVREAQGRPPVRTERRLPSAGSGVAKPLGSWNGEGPTPYHQLKLRLMGNACEMLKHRNHTKGYNPPLPWAKVVPSGSGCFGFKARKVEQSTGP